jgi:3-oxoacyl-[acyl-carrier protein] reductase
MARRRSTPGAEIDILVNNAGITHMPAPMEDVSEEDFDRVLAVNVKSVYLTAREIVPLMKAAGRARSSTSPPPPGFPPGPGSTGTMPPRAG